MAKKTDLKAALFQTIIQDIRENHKDAIDKAYAYFWDDCAPDEFLSGTALELGFINFEDWLVCDYKINEKKETFIDLFMRKEKGLKEEETDLLNAMRSSVLSLYEVASVAKDKRVMLKDLLLSGECELRDKHLTRGLEKGNIFAARILTMEGKSVMSGCVYPYNQGQKKKVLAYIDRQFSRYKRNEKSDGTMKDYLKDYGDVFNLAWMNLILDQIQKED